MIMDPDMRQLGLFRIIAFTRQGSPNPRFGYCYTYPGQILWDKQSSQLRKFLLRCGRSSKLVSAAQSGLVRRRVSHQFRGLSLTWTCSHTCSFGYQLGDNLAAQLHTVAWLQGQLSILIELVSSFIIIRIKMLLLHQ